MAGGEHLVRPLDHTRLQGEVLLCIVAEVCHLVGTVLQPGLVVRGTHLIAARIGPQPESAVGIEYRIGGVRRRSRLGVLWILGLPARVLFCLTRVLIASTRFFLQAAPLFEPANALFLLAQLLVALFVRLAALSALLRLVRPLAFDAFGGRAADRLRSFVPACCA